MSLREKTVNGETWYMNGNQRISKEEYDSIKTEQTSHVRKRFSVSLSGILTDITEEVSANGAE